MSDRIVLRTTRGSLSTHPGTPLTVRIEYDRFDSSQLSVQLVLADSGDAGRTALAACAECVHEPATIVSNDDRSDDVTLMSYSSRTIRPPSSIDIEAQELRIGMTRPPHPDPVRLHLRVDLTPSNILGNRRIGTRSYTGSITYEDDALDKAQFATPLGDWQATDQYDFFDTAIAEHAVLSRVQGAILTGPVTVPPGQSLATFHDAVCSEVALACDALSLAYRRPVRPFAYEYLPIDTTVWGPRSPVVRLRRRPAQLDDSNCELIDYEGLSRGALFALINALRDHASGHDLRRAISFLAASHRSELAEDGFFLAFAALELLIQICDGSSGGGIPPAEWKNISRALREVLRRTCESPGMSASAEQLIQKLPELRRRSVKERILRVVSASGISVDDIWPTRGFAGGIAQAIGSRNRLFHAADVRDLDELVCDRHRVSALFERLIIRELGLPEDRLSPLRDLDLRRINRFS